MANNKRNLKSGIRRLKPELLREMSRIIEESHGVNGKKPKPGDVARIPHQPNGILSLLNKTDVMAILKVSRSTIQAAMLAGELGFVKFGRAVRFRSDDIVAFVAGKRIAPTKEGK